MWGRRGAAPSPATGGAGEQGDDLLAAGAPAQPPLGGGRRVSPAGPAELAVGEQSRILFSTYLSPVYLCGHFAAFGVATRRAFAGGRGPGAPLSAEEGAGHPRAARQPPPLLFPCSPGRSWDAIAGAAPGPRLL